MRTTATMHALHSDRGAVRVEEVYDTDVEDLWDACTTPARLGRLIAEVSGEPGVGETVPVTFTSSWTGNATVETCDRPHHLLVTLASLHFYGAGWQAHLEDLGRSLDGAPSEWKARRRSGGAVVGASSGVRGTHARQLT